MYAYEDELTPANAGIKLYRFANQNYPDPLRVHRALLMAAATENEPGLVSAHTASAGFPTCPRRS